MTSLRSTERQAFLVYWSILPSKRIKDKKPTFKWIGFLC